MSEVPMDLRSAVVAGNFLATLRNCRGYYECPKDAEGRRLGPLVGYAGKYKDDQGVERNWVGEVYYNFAMAEQNPLVMDFFARSLSEEIRGRFEPVPDYVVGMPLGGLCLAAHLAFALRCGYATLEKKVTKAGTPESREEAELVWGRHEVSPRSRVAIVEDVVNNFSTTEKALQLINDAGSVVVAIACGLNRSSVTIYDEGVAYVPVIPLILAPTAQYKQNDPYVAADVAANNVVWKVKPEWARLEAAMKAASGG